MRIPSHSISVCETCAYAPKQWSKRRWEASPFRRLKFRSHVCWGGGIFTRVQCKV